jgi:hypothetical protein
MLTPQFGLVRDLRKTGVSCGHQVHTRQRVYLFLEIGLLGALGISEP